MQICHQVNAKNLFEEHLTNLQYGKVDNYRSFLFCLFSYFCQENSYNIY